MEAPIFDSSIVAVPNGKQSQNAPEEPLVSNPEADENSQNSCVSVNSSGKKSTTNAINDVTDGINNPNTARANHITNASQKDQLLTKRTFKQSGASANEF